jgi:hypothetical protein
MDGVIEKTCKDKSEHDEITSIHGGGPIITLPPDPKYRAYYLLDDQLNAIAENGNSCHSTFASIAIGVFFTALTTLMAGELYPRHPEFFIVCVVLTVGSGFTGLLSGTLWFKNRKRVKGLLQEIRSQYPK